MAKKKPAAPKLREIVAAIDESGNEAIYVNGKLFSQYSTIYAGDIVEACQGKPCIVRQVEVEDFNNAVWPKDLKRVYEISATTEVAGQEITRTKPTEKKRNKTSPRG